MLRKKPFVLTLHGFPRDFEKLGHKIYFDLIGKKTLEAAKRIISVSKIVALEFETIGVPTRKVTVIPNGIDLKEFEQLPDGTRFRKRFSIEEGEKMILAVGRLEKTKGFQHAIMAMAKLRRKYPVKLLIAGPNLDYGHQLRKIAKKAGVNDKVVFCGPINKREKLEALAAADAVIIPSTYEGFGIFILEALAARKPVVATRTGVASEVIRNGENGFLVNPGDLGDLTEKLAYLLGDDRLSREMSNRSQENIKAFDWKAITRQILSVYNECLEGSGN
jgi:glycosyltransferase involved in cell wall biosynthesis